MDLCEEAEENHDNIIKNGFCEEAEENHDNLGILGFLLLG
jgi:hypothetical protein